MSINMDPEGVYQAAEDMAALASVRVGHSLDSSQVAASVHPGWASSGALRDCRQVWVKHLTDLVNQVDEAAKKLRASASSNQQTDAEAAGRFGQVLRELSH